MIDGVRHEEDLCNQMPQAPPMVADRSSSDRAVKGREVRSLAIKVACLASYPLLVTTGWLAGDENGVIFVDSLWSGPFPVLASLGFVLVMATLAPFVVGVAVLAANPERKRGYVLLLCGSAIAGLLSFLLFFMINEL